MSIQFYLGPSGSGKSTIAYKEIIQKALANPQMHYYILVPDQYTMTTQKKLVTMHPDRGIINIDILSFGRLAHRVMEELDGRKLPVLDDTGTNLILRKIAMEHREELPYFGEKLSRVGYIHEIKSVISEFMQYGITEDELERMKEETGSQGILNVKLGELLKLYVWFKEYIDDHFSTKEELLDRLTRLLPKSAIVHDSEFFFDGFTGFTPIQGRVIQTLMELCKRVSFSITLDCKYNPYKIGEEHELFHLSQKTISYLCKLQEEAGVLKEEDVVIDAYPVLRYQKNEEMAFMEKHLFRFGTNAYSGSVESIEMFHTDTLYEEVRFALRKIKKLVRENGYQYRNIAVVAGNLEAYADLIEKEAAVMEIPIYLDRNTSVMMNPLVEFIKAAISLSLKNYSYESVMQYLRCGFSKVSKQEADLLEQYIRALNIRGKRKYEEMFVLHTKKTGSGAEVLEQLNQIRERFYGEISVLYPKEKAPTMRDKIMRIYHFLEKTGVQEKLQLFEEKFKASGDLKREREYAAVYKLILQLFEQMEALLGDETLSWQEFYEIFEAGVTEIKAGTLPQDVDRVVCGDIERTRLDGTKILFFVGVNDGNVPKGSSGGGILSDYDREFLSEKAFELSPSPKSQMYIQKLYLYMLLTKPTDRVILSYAHVGMDGRTIRPSYLIGVLCKLFPELHIQKLGADKDLEHLASFPDALQAFSPRLGLYAAGYMDHKEQEKKETSTLYHLLNEKLNIVDELMKIAFATRRHTELSQALAEVLYGGVLKRSVSQLEKYAECEYRYFLQYGLSLKEREEFSISSMDIGSMYHAILQLFSEELEKEKLSWFSFSDEDCDRILGDIMSTYSPDNKEAVFYGSARNANQIDIIASVMKRSIQNLAYQVRQGLFEPSAFEMSFETVVDVDQYSFSKSPAKPVHLVGKIDRIDEYKKDDSVYIKVIDYKSSDKNIDIVSIYHGLSLQLVMYMNAALEKKKKDNPNTKVIPAGILYYHLQDPIVEAGSEEISDEEIEIKIRNAMKMNGLITGGAASASFMDRKLLEQTGSSDVVPARSNKGGEIPLSNHLIEGDTFQIISNYVNYKVCQISEDILKGKMDRNPFQQGEKDACAYCPYQDACAYDETLGDSIKRRIANENTDVILQKMSDELKAECCR